MKIHFAVLALACLLSAKTAAAEDRLPYGLVYNATENSGAKFTCSNSAGNEMECEFTQITVLKKAKAGELDKALEEARKQFRAAGQPKQMDCSDFENSLASLRGLSSNLKPDRIAAIQKLNARERQDLEKMTVPLIAFCKNPTEENLLSLTKLSHEKESKSCRIFTSTFTQKFKMITADTWASNEGPGGLCGVVVVSSLNRVTASTSKFWVYKTKKVVNNKNPEICRGLDEAEYFYDWRGGGDRFVGCDYIEMAF